MIAGHPPKAEAHTSCYIIGPLINLLTSLCLYSELVYDIQRQVVFSVSRLLATARYAAGVMCKCAFALQ